MLGEENNIAALTGESIVAAGAKKFDIIKTGVFWFAAGYAVALFVGRKKKIVS